MSRRSVSACRLWVRAGLPGLIVAMAGCATQNCNPASDPGFLGAIGCNVGGAYGERVTQQGSELEQARERKRRLADELARTETEKERTEAERSRKEHELADLQRQTSTIQARMAKSKKKNADLTRRIASVQKEIERLRKTPPPDQESTKTRNRLRKELSDLEQALEAAQ
jgi:chromosome segregation ATPase